MSALHMFIGALMLACGVALICLGVHERRYEIRLGNERASVGYSDDQP